MGIVATAAHKAHASLLQSSEAYALTAMALADGFISSWEEKFRSNVVRPETMINASHRRSVAAAPADAAVPRIHERPQRHLDSGGDGADQCVR